MSGRLITLALFSAALMAPGIVLGAPLEKKGSTSYTSHYVFHPLGITELPGVGKVSALEMVGTTENTKGEPVFDKMKAKCNAVKVEAGDKTYFDGACAMTDADGDIVFSTFDTRDLDKSQPKMDCGTHFIKGGSGKYAGITGLEPFACISKATPPGEPAGSFAMDIPLNSTWQINAGAATGAGTGESGGATQMKK